MDWIQRNESVHAGSRSTMPGSVGVVVARPETLTFPTMASSCAWSPPVPLPVTAIPSTDLVLPTRPISAYIARLFELVPSMSVLAFVDVHGYLGGGH